MEENLIELFDTPSSSAEKEFPKPAGDPEKEDEAKSNTGASTNCQLDLSNKNDTSNDTKVKFDVRCLPQAWKLQEFDDFGRESLGIINFDMLDLGRPSLAIVNLKSADPSVPCVVISPPKENKEAVENKSMLNTAFMLPNDNSSVSSSISSFYSRDPCGFSKSLNCSEFSTISNIKSTSYKMDLSNDPLETSKQFERLHVSDSPKSSDIGEPGKYSKREIHSVPDDMKLLDEIDLLGGQNDSDPLSFLVKNEDFSNDVFLEDRSAMPKFPTRLLTEDSPNLLDCTPQPDEFFDLFEDNGLTASKSKPEDLFKNLDKMMPPSSVIQPNALKEEGSGITSEHVPDAQSSSTKHSSNPKLDDARKMLHSLSLIINKDNFAEEQKTEVQALLKSLNSLFSDAADIPLAVDSNDSGHSSINAESGCTSSPVVLAQDAALDLSTNSPLDLSRKSKLVNDGANPFSSLIKSSATKTMVNLTSMRDSKTINPCFSKTKSISKILVKSKELSRKSSDTRKGPMKAVVPISSMPKLDAPRSSMQITPKKNERRSLVSKKTSTPITQGPVAQSTPEASINQSVRSNASTYSQRVYPTSPLSSRSTYMMRNASADRSKMNDSRTSPKLTPGLIRRESKYQGYLRRRSTDLKSPANGCASQKDNVLLPLQKTNDIGKSPSRVVKIAGYKNNSGDGENIVKNNLRFSTGKLHGKENFKC